MAGVSGASQPAAASPVGVGAFSDITLLAFPRGQCRQISFLKREGAWSGITSYARRTGAWPRGQRAARSTATEG